MEFEKISQNKERPRLEEPHIIFSDPDSIRIYFPKSDAYITVSCIFPTMEDSDKFLLSPRSLEDFEKYKGIFIVGKFSSPSKTKASLQEANQPKSEGKLNPDELPLTKEEFKQLRKINENYFLKS